MHWFLSGVVHDAWGLHWVVSHLLVLQAITHVELTPLPLPEVGESAGPDS